MDIQATGQIVYGVLSSMDQTTREDSSSPAMRPSLYPRQQPRLGKVRQQKTTEAVMGGSQQRVRLRLAGRGAPPN